jgi:hypothetical protein
MIFGWGRRRKQLLDEIEEHIELETQENVDAGMSQEAARRATMRKFGNPLTAVEDSSEVWAGFGWSGWRRMCATHCGSCAGIPNLH